MDISMINHVSDSSKWELLIDNDECVICKHTEPCDDYIHAVGSAFAIAQKTILTDNSGRKSGIIFCASYLSKLDEETQNFVMCHEVGHIVNGDLENMTGLLSRLIMLLRILGIVPKMEIMADAFAASVIGKDATKKSLMWLAKFKPLGLIGRRDAFIRWLVLSLLPIKNV